MPIKVNLKFLMTDLASFADLLRSTLNQETTNEATDHIRQIMEENPMDFIVSCISLITNEAFSSILSLSTTHLIIAILSGRENFENSGQMLRENPEILGNLFEVSKILAGSDNEVIRNNISKILAILFYFHPLQENPIFLFCQEILGDSEQSCEIQSSMIHVYDNILNIPAFNKKFASSKEFGEISDFFFSTCIKIIGIEPEEGDHEVLFNLKSTTVGLLVTMFEKFKDYHNQAKLEAILESLPASFKFPSVDLFVKLNQLMFVMTKTFYEHADTFFSQIHEYTMLSLQMDDQDYVIPALNFLIEIGKFEVDFLNERSLYRPETLPTKYQKFIGILRKSAEEMLPVIMNMMKSFNPEETKCEEKGEISLQSEAAMTFVYFMRAAPEETTPFILESFDQLISEGTWPALHTAVMFLYAMIDKRNIPVSTKEEYKRYEEDRNNAMAYINDRLDFLIDVSTQNDVPQLKDTGLWCLCEAIYFISPIVLKVPGRNKENYERILPLFELKEDTDPFIIEHMCQLLTRISKTIYERMWHSPVTAEVVQRIEAFIDSIKQSEQCKCNMYLFNVAVEGFNSFIKTIPAEIADSYLPALLEKERTNLSSVVNDVPLYPVQGEDKNIVIAGLCNEITGILSHSCKIKTDDFAQGFIAELMEIANDPLQFSFDDAVETIIHVIDNLCNGSQAEYLKDEKIYGMIFAGIKCENTESSKICCSFLSRAITKYTASYDENKLDIVNTLFEIFQENQNDSIKGLILQTIGDILVATKGMFRSDVIGLSDTYFEFIHQAIGFLSGIEYMPDGCLEMDELFGSVAHSLMCYFDVFKYIYSNTTEFDRNKYEVEIHKILKIFMKRVIIIRPTRNTLKELHDMLNLLAEITTRPLNSKANSRENMRVVSFIRSDRKYKKLGDILKEKLAKT